MNFDEYLENALSSDDELSKEYDAIKAKEVKVTCPKCGNIMTYRDWLSWILHTPFHWFGKRRAKCTRCGEYAYMGRLK